MRGRFAALRPLLPGDYPRLYEMAMAEQMAFRWRYAGGVPNYELFVETVTQGLLCQFAVTPIASDEMVGVVVCYSADMRNGHAYLGVMIDERRVGSGAGIEAMALFVGYLMKTWPFRKLYFEASSFNYGKYSSGEGVLFHLEGRMRAHWYYLGVYWDELLLAIYRSDVENHLSDLLP